MLVHHIVADLQFLEIADNFSGEIFRALFPALASENIRIGQYHEFDFRIFVALADKTAEGHNFAGL